MFKKNVLLFTLTIMSSNCFGMKKPSSNNKNQNIFTVATMQLLKFFFNPNKPKQLPAPTPTPKEFVCKEKANENQRDAEIKEALNKLKHPSVIKKENSNIASDWELQEEAKLNKEIEEEFARIKRDRYSKKQ